MLPIVDVLGSEDSEVNQEDDMTIVTEIGCTTGFDSRDSVPGCLVQRLWKTSARDCVVWSSFAYPECERAYCAGRVVPPASARWDRPRQ